MRLAPAGVVTGREALLVLFGRPAAGTSARNRKVA